MEGHRKKAKGQKKEDSSIFPTFFMAGFECSTFIWKDGKRKDYVAITGHDQQVVQSCRRCAEQVGEHA